MAFAGVLLVVLTSNAVVAASGRVILLQPHAASASARRSLTLIHDELTAGGFDVVSVDAGPDSDPVSIAALMRRQQGAVATIALLGNPETGRSELWILDQIGGAAEVRRIPAPTEEPERAAEVLAIRTMELLRASALKWLVESSRPAARPPTPTVEASPAPNVPAAPAQTVGIETGLSVLYSVGGLAPAALPVGRLRISIAAPVFVRLSVAGLGTRPRVDSALGSRGRGAGAGPSRDRRHISAWPPVRAADHPGRGGLSRAHQGQGLSPYLGERDQSWAAMFDAAPGLRDGERGAGDRHRAACVPGRSVVASSASTT